MSQEITEDILASLEMAWDALMVNDRLSAENEIRTAIVAYCSLHGLTIPLAVRTERVAARHGSMTKVAARPAPTSSEETDTDDPVSAPTGEEILANIEASSPPWKPADGQYVRGELMNEGKCVQIVWIMPNWRKHYANEDAIRIFVERCYAIKSDALNLPPKRYVMPKKGFMFLEPAF